MKYLLLLTSMCLAISCSKVSPTATSVKGKVIDINTGEPIPDLKILILAHEFSLAGVGETSTEATFFTNQDGQFEHEFSAKLSKRYECTVDLGTANLLVDLRGLGNHSEDILEGENNTFEFRITFSAYLRENIVNVNCDSSVILEVIQQTQIPNVGFDFTSRPCQSVILEEFHPTPYGNQIYTWRTLRDGEVLTENRDSFYLEIGERKEFTIEW